VHCRSALISQRSVAASESTDFESEWLLLRAVGFFNDDERRAGSVSPFSSDPEGARSPLAPSSGLRPSLQDGSARRRPADRGAFGEKRPDMEQVRLFNLEAGRERGDAESGPAPAAGDPAPATAAGRLRHRDRGATGGGGERLREPEGGGGEAVGAGAPDRRAGVAARTVLALIRAYQRGISPGLGTLCRYQPSCSHYAYEAVERYGAIRGSWLGVRRLVRCTPLGRGGYDPVP
jgi:uncharacterized protein